MFSLSSLSAPGFTWQKALSLAMASNLSYENESLVKNIAKNSWGFDDCIFFDVNETQGFVAHNAEVVMVAFRGTESLGDWLGNLRLLATPRPYGKVHSGFLGGYLAVKDNIHGAFSTANAANKRVLVTGHSLGGALASIMAAESPVTIESIYTFGQPRTGNEDFKQVLAEKSYFRFVNDDDIVPRVPPGYVHAGRLIHFDSQGNLHRPANEAEESAIEPPPLSAEEFFELQRQIKEVQLGVAVAGAPSEAFDASVEGLFPSVSDHALERYIAAIRRFAENTAQGDAMGAEVHARAPLALSMAESNVADVEVQKVPVLLRLNSSSWEAPEGLQVNSRFGCIVSAEATPDQLRKLEDDNGVAAIEASRDAGVMELAQSVPFVGGDIVHRPPLSETGRESLVGLIDLGIDVLHEAFRDDSNTTRIIAIWDQRDDRGPSPHSVDTAFSQKYGTLYSQTEINRFLNGTPLPTSALRDPLGHGTHVASIAAGRAAGALPDGIAPDSRIVVVIPKMKTAPGDPPSLGYSVSHVDALHFLKSVAAGGNAVLSDARPIVVNVSLGMNAGAHDGSSTLEAAFDAVSNSGRDPGFVIVKSAGNECQEAGHARERVIQGGVVRVRWDSNSQFRFQDYLEVWYSSLDTLRFELVDPAGNRSETVSLTNPVVDQVLGGNLCQLRLTDLHADNGDNRLTITLLPQSTTLQPGIWELCIEGVAINSSDGVVDVWMERGDSRPTRFLRPDESITLSIPGTAKTVITVSGCQPTVPLQMVPSSSKGRTRDGRPKPDLCAPGANIIAARSNTNDHRAVIGLTGTSMAAPHVTGAVALALSRRFQQMQQQAGLSQFNARQIQAALVRSVKNFSHVHHEGSGFGVLDIVNFMNAL